ncbi:hypothetical protein H1S01_03220 [Heliobacterium chlorum]|uniref:Uncharacterized protein n=1 Tax=Heliobacterium chlorum TaxID=2698 RepID=A0ABR7T013_HELCL|nr:hypothetical protein [Heliobacterium chlorum]MBC9783522.1 hypothetical protein [Heliobacterium chlorum]
MKRGRCMGVSEKLVFPSLADGNHGDESELPGEANKVTTYFVDPAELHKKYGPPGYLMNGQKGKKTNSLWGGYPTKEKDKEEKGRDKEMAKVKVLTLDDLFKHYEKGMTKWALATKVARAIDSNPANVNAKMTSMGIDSGINDLKAKHEKWLAEKETANGQVQPTLETQEAATPAEEVVAAVNEGTPSILPQEASIDTDGCKDIAYHAEDACTNEISCDVAENKEDSTVEMTDLSVNHSDTDDQVSIIPYSWPVTIRRNHDKAVEFNNYQEAIAFMQDEFSRKAVREGKITMTITVPVEVLISEMDNR